MFLNYNVQLFGTLGVNLCVCKSKYIYGQELCLNQVSYNWGWSKNLQESSSPGTELEQYYSSCIHTFIYWEIWVVHVYSVSCFTLRYWFFLLLRQIFVTTYSCFFQDCDGMQFTVLGDLVQCGLSDSETCLKAVTLSLSEGATVSILWLTCSQPLTAVDVFPLILLGFRL